MSPQPPKSSIWAAGGVVVRHRPVLASEYLLVHRPRYDDWSLPKGKLDTGESFKQAALREVEEETGMRCSALARVGTISYETPNRNMKVVRYWLLNAEGGSFAPNKEVDAIKWATEHEAHDILSYERDREVLDWAIRLAADPTAGRIYLVRHANAGDRKRWARADELRPISLQGEKQADALRDYLSGYPLTTVYTSSYVRCVQTMGPLAGVLGSKLEIEPTLVEDAAPDEFIAAVGRWSGQAVAMGSHRQLISGTITRLAASGIPMDGPMECDKGSIWILETSRGKVRSGRYVNALV
jgi:8-oxo-dGTP diphosphatase